MVLFRFYEELNRFMPPGRKRKDFEVSLSDGTSVYRAIKDMGVPPDEVDLVLVNGGPSGFERILNPGDRVSVYPVFERLDISKITRLPGRPLRKPRFIVDLDLRPLAERLRSLGLDVRFDSTLSRSGLTKACLEEKRILLTRDPSFMSDTGVERCIVLSGKDRVESLAEEVMSSMDL
ncbi:MAG: Mut7-C RNAse domain-containing protein [Desulfobacteraceae bacterium]